MHHIAAERAPLDRDGVALARLVGLAAAVDDAADERRVRRLRIRGHRGRAQEQADADPGNVSELHFAPPKQPSATLSDTAGARLPCVPFATTCPLSLRPRSDS